MVLLLTGLCVCIFNQQEYLTDSTHSSGVRASAYGTLMLLIAPLYYGLIATNIVLLIANLFYVIANFKNRRERNSAIGRLPYFLAALVLLFWPKIIYFGPIPKYI